MKSLIIYIVAICYCFADGCFVLKTGEHATEPSQRATIFYADGIQDTFLQVSLEGEVSEFGWLVPVPSKPTLEQIDKIPEFETKKLFFSTPIDRLKLWKRAFTPFGGTTPELSFSVERQTLPNYTVDIISPEGDGIGLWLRSQNFNVDDQAVKIIDNYRKNGWYFCAIKLKASKMIKQHRTLLPPIKFSFKTDKPVFPLRISAINNSPSLVEVNFISPKLYTPLVKLLPKDIPTQKDAIKYTLFGKACPHDVVLQPISYNKIRKAVNLNEFRRTDKVTVYPALYQVTLKKWYKADEMTDDIYFDSSEEAAFNLLKSQQKLYQLPEKSFLSKYGVLEDFYEPFELTKANLAKFAPIAPYRDFEDFISEKIKMSFYASSWDDENENRSIDLDNMHIIFSRADHDKKIVKAKQFIKLMKMSYANNQWNPELYKLLNSYPKYRFSTKAELSDEDDGIVDDYDFFNDDSEANSNQLKSSRDFIDDNLLTKPQRWSYDFHDNHCYPDLQTLVKQAIRIWDINSNVPNYFIKNEQTALHYLRKFSHDQALNCISKKYRSAPAMYDKKKQFYHFNTAGIELDFKYLYETNIYLRKIVRDRFSVHSDFFYGFETKEGTSTPFNSYFFTLLSQQKQSLIPILIEWLKSDQTELRHNAVLALAHISFLSLDHGEEAQKAIALYKKDLDDCLPLNLCDNDGYFFWSFILRINYALNTGDLSENYFRILELCDESRVYTGKGEEVTISYRFETDEVYQRITKLSSRFNSHSKEEIAEFKRTIKDYFLDSESDNIAIRSDFF